MSIKKPTKENNTTISYNLYEIARKKLFGIHEVK